MNKIVFFATIILLLVTLIKAEKGPADTPNSSVVSPSTQEQQKHRHGGWLQINQNLQANGQEQTQPNGSLLRRLVRRKGNFLRGVGRDVSVTWGKILGRTVNVSDDLENHAVQAYKDVRNTPSALEEEMARRHKRQESKKKL